MIQDPRPFGGWQPFASGLFPSAPPPLLIEPPEVQYHYDYASLKAYRLQSQPYVVVVTYDMVQEMIEDRIKFEEDMRFQAWLQWVERNI